MRPQSVRDLMLPLSEYAVVPESATLKDALRTLKEAQKILPPGYQPPRAVLVVDENREVVGQLDHLGILGALEPRYGLLRDMETLSRAGVSEDTVGSLIENLAFWQGRLEDVCQRAASIEVKDLMRSVTESVDENEPLAQAVHKIVLWQAMRIMVTRNGKVIGVLRLADVIAAVAAAIEESAE